jgi:signal transduction histidine kinase
MQSFEFPVRRRQLIAYALAPILVGAALWLELWLGAGSSSRFFFFAFSPAVGLVALIGGFGPGALALLLSAVASDYYLLGAGRMFHVSTPPEAIALFGFLVAWLPMTLLAGRLYRQRVEKDNQRVHAERAAARADRLEQMTAAFAMAVQPAGAIEACVQEAAHWLQANSGALLLLSEDGTSLELVRAIGYPDDLKEALARIPIEDCGPMGDAVGRRAPVFLESRDQYTDEYGDRAGSLYLPEHQATVAAPLIGSGGVSAVLRLDFHAPRTFDPEERDLLAQLAPRAAQALDRTRQHEFAQLARAESELLRQRADQELEERLKIEQALRASEVRYRSLAARTSRLHALTAALSESVTVEAVGRALVHRGRIVVGATAADVVMLVEEGLAFETLYSDPPETVGTRMPAENGLCATEALTTKAPVFIRTFEEMQQRCWLSAAAAADGGYASSAALPLVVENSVIGVLSFHFTVPVNFDSEYKALLISVAQHCAQALDRARLYESAQQARTEAEAANRLKDDFLSIVSHELRTPLSSILGWIQILQRPDIEPAIANRALQSIRDNATRQAKLVDDLLDFSRIVAGRLMLDRQRINVRELLRGVVETVLPVATAQGIDLRCPDAPDAPIMGDLRRLEQIFLNLLGNALKFTPAGGSVELAARTITSGVEIRVSDTGIGIDPEFLPHVFERFRQAEPTASRTHEGIGLGLSIAKQLVEAHGGTISVTSEGRGSGTSFIVTLPGAARQDESAKSWSFADSERAGV